MSLEERAQLLQQAARNTGFQEVQMEICRRDPVYWFNHYAWTFDPRDGKGELPFDLYPFQEWFIEVLRGKIDNQTDIDIEKSRTIGATWVIMGLFVWYWLFVPNSSFLVGSITEEDVDKNLVDPEDTLFGKVRFIYQYLPEWMRPRDIVDKHLALKNNGNGSAIIGKAPTSNFGRSARKTAIFFDEVAFWQWGRAAYASASQTTKCRIMCSTPNGKYDVYGERMTREGAKRLIWPGRAELVKTKGLYG